jgi:uncharacterized membrane protein
MTFPTIVLIATATAAGLTAGLFYAYSCSVNPGLRRLSDAAYLAAMQSINRAILNPAFFAIFIGTLLLLPTSAYLHYPQPSSPRFIFLLLASILYVTCVFGVTVFGSVPLNEALDRFALHSLSIQDISQERLKFEKPWNRLHAIRTLASVTALVLILIACVIN